MNGYRTGQWIYKVSLAHIIVKIISKKENQQHNNEVSQRDTELTKRAPNGQGWYNLSKNISKVVLGFNPIYKINIHAYMLI